MPEKVTIMVLEVDLQCRRCYRKINRVLRKFRQIQDQIYDEKRNTVTIKVVYCCPEKMRNKISYEGGGSIRSIEILVPEKPKVVEKVATVKKVIEIEKKKEPEPEPTKLPPIIPVPAYPPAYPTCAYCGWAPGSEGYGEIPCFHGHGHGVPPPYYEDYGRPVYDSYGGGYRGDYENPRPAYDSYGGRYMGDCFSEENPSGCTIM